MSTGTSHDTIRATLARSQPRFAVLSVLLPSKRGAEFRFFLLITTSIATLGMASCSSSRVPTRPPLPHSGYAFISYWNPLWVLDTMIIFNHVPMRSLTYNPTSRSYEYVFLDSLSGLWALRPDGTAQRRLLNAHVDDPDYDSTGQRLAYERGDQIYTATLVAGQLDSSSVRQLTSSGRNYTPSWDREARRIAWRQSGEALGVWVMNSDGGERRILVAGARDPDWHPELDSVVLANRGAILIADATTGETSTLVDVSPDRPEHPKFSPTGDRVAFIRGSTMGRPAQLWVMNADGSNRRALTTRGVGSTFAWNREGSAIVYVQYNLLAFTYENGTLWIVDVASGSSVQLTKNPFTPHPEE
jgi:hypothetical protein